MLNNINIENVLFIDIETVPSCPEYSLLSQSLRALWDHKAKFIRREENDNAESLYERAGIYSEFGKVICISTGYVYRKENTSQGDRNSRHERQMRIKSFYGDDEAKILSDFSALLNKSFFNDYHRLCAHNGKEFDFPYLSRRTLINDLPLPRLLDTAGRKPWEIQHIDTFELWKFGDLKNYTSLELLATIMNIPTPKDDITGKDIARVYWQDKDMDRIIRYCQKDVMTVAQLFLKFKGDALINPDDIIIVE